jgi:hypothetical protein
MLVRSCGWKYTADDLRRLLIDRRTSRPVVEMTDTRSRGGTVRSSASPAFASPTRPAGRPLIELLEREHAEHFGRVIG